MILPKFMLITGVTGLKLTADPKVCSVCMFSQGRMSQVNHHPSGQQFGILWGMESGFLVRGFFKPVCLRSLLG